MDDRSLTTSEIHARRSPMRKSAFVVVLGLLLGGLALMEGPGTAQRAPAGRAAVEGPFGLGCAFSGAARTSPEPVPRTSRSGPSNADQAMARANQVAADAQSTIQRAVAQQPPQPGLFCPLLLRVRASLIAQFDALERVFPALTARLEPIRAQVLATINAVLARFGCPIPSLR